MNDLMQSLTEHRRLSALRALTVIPYETELRRDQLAVLARLPGNTGNVSLCRDILEEAGYELSRDKLTGCAAWLAEQGLVQIYRQETTMVLTLAERGEDVAAGRVSVPGIAPQTDYSWMVQAMENYGLIVSLPEVIEIVGWLETHHLVRRDWAGCVSLTRRGTDVASGRVVLAGVKKPSGSAIMATAAVIARTRLDG